ncbi:hypothetical protein, partial [Staphylococcus aureus]|uniref:hypothetical protein n=1 Tax=Staphylococcus aureus TaxID=1280 RepID=UPI001E2FBDF5
DYSIAELREELNFVLESAVGDFQENIEKPNLPLILSVVVIRHYFSRNQISKINSSVNHSTINTVLCNPIAAKPEAFLTTL